MTHPTAAADASAPATVTAHLFAAASSALGADQLEVSGRTVADALAQLAERTDDAGRRVLDRSSVLLNSIACPDRSTALSDGDRVDVLPPFAGG